MASIRPRRFSPLDFINTLIASRAKYRRLARARVVRSEFLCFNRGGKEYALDILHVRRILAHEPLLRVANASRWVKGLVNESRNMVPVVDLLGDCARGTGEDRFATVVTLDVAHRRLGVVIDGVSDVVGLATDQIRAVPAPDDAAEPRFICAQACVEGRILHVVDVARLMETCGS